MPNPATTDADAAARAGLDDPRLPMRDRILEAAKRLASSDDARSLNVTLRREQEGVFADFVEYLTDIATRPEHDAGDAPFGRIIQPPRTGKTVIAGKIIADTHLRTLFIVPTKTLVEQAAGEFAGRFDGLPVGVYYGEEKRLVRNGVNVTTYAILQKQWKDGRLPEPIRSAALVIADEAHQAMTLLRSSLLRNAFDPDAIRIALTATPDYNEERVLSRHFPHLIHEITLPEAVELDLLAPLRVWVAEVDADGSVVKVVQGDYQEGVLGRLMSEAPFFKAAETFRYAEENRGMPALVSCVSRQQAYDLLKYLEAHRPEGTPAPALILGDTPSEDRRKALARFDRGVIDTLINVGVLIQGWNSPRCKLLIDLAPTVSRVRATQKFCRVLTKHDDAEARIYMVVPCKLAQNPIMPMELLAPSLEAYETGDILASPRRIGTSTTQRLRHPRIHPVERVELKSRILLSLKVEKPLLNPSERQEVRSVLDSHVSFDPSDTPTFWRFRSFMFEHPLFTGRGDHLVHVCGFRGTTWDFKSFLMRYAPDAAANFMYKRKGLPEDESCLVEIRDLEARLARRKHRLSPETKYTLWRTVCGPLENAMPPDEALDLQKRARQVKDLLDNVPLGPAQFGAPHPIEVSIIRWRFGLDGEEKLTYKEISNRFSLCTERIRQLEIRSLVKLREAYAETEAEPEKRRIEELLKAASTPTGPLQMKKRKPAAVPPGASLEEQIVAFGVGRYEKLKGWYAPIPRRLHPKPHPPPLSFEEQVRAYGIENYEALTGWYAPLPDRPRNWELTDEGWVRNRPPNYFARGYRDPE